MASDPSRSASTIDPSTWSTFAIAKEAVVTGQASHLGFVLGEPHVGVDLDKCRHPETGALAEWAAQIVRTADSYAEVSLSGTGVHIIARGILPAGRRRT